MKARKIQPRNQLMYAEIIRNYNTKAIGLVLRFKKSREGIISGVVVKSELKNYPVGHSKGRWSNPLSDSKNWKILTDFKEE